MQEPLLKSVIFHLIVAILLVASSWSIFSRKEKIPDVKPIVVQLAPMGDITNLKPAPKREVTPPKPKTETKPEPKPEPKKPEPKKPEPKKPEPKKEEPKKVDPKKVDPKKPEPKKDEKKPEKKKDDIDKMLEDLDKPEKKKSEPKEDSELKDLLKDLDKKPEVTKSSDAKDTNPNSKSDAPFDPNSPESLAVVDYITKVIVDQIKPCWSPPAGGRDAQNTVVRVNVDISPDGTMKFVGFESSGTGSVYKVAEDAARRAILDPMCNPLKTKPPADKYYIWKEMTLTFDPRQLVY